MLKLNLFRLFGLGCVSDNLMLSFIPYGHFEASVLVTSTEAPNNFAIE